MSIQSTTEQLRTLRLLGMVAALEHQLSQTVFYEMAFDQRLSMLAEAEINHRDAKRYTRLIKDAKLKVAAQPEDIDYSLARGIDKSVIAELLTCTWTIQHQNLILTGATGTGKTWLACAMAVAAARKGMTIAYRRVGRLLEQFETAHHEGSIGKQRHQFAKVQLLILDDFGLTPLTSQGRTELLELLDDRVGTQSTIILGQLPIKDWHAFINDPALADAILDRLVHNSHKLNLKGESMRRQSKK